MKWADHYLSTLRTLSKTRLGQNSVKGNFATDNAEFHVWLEGAETSRAFHSAPFRVCVQSKEWKLCLVNLLKDCVTCKIRRLPTRNWKRIQKVKLRALSLSRLNDNWWAEMVRQSYSVLYLHCAHAVSWSWAIIKSDGHQCLSNVISPKWWNYC